MHSPRSIFEFATNIKLSEPACCKCLGFLIQYHQSYPVRRIQSMDPREMALFTSVFHLPAGIAVTSVQPSASELVIGVACHALSMPCPECHQLSACIHGHYQRTVADRLCCKKSLGNAMDMKKCCTFSLGSYFKQAGDELHLT